MQDYAWKALVSEANLAETKHVSSAMVRYSRRDRVSKITSAVFDLSIVEVQVTRRCTDTFGQG